MKHGGTRSKIAGVWPQTGPKLDNQRGSIFAGPHIGTPSVQTVPTLGSKVYKEYLRSVYLESSGTAVL